MKDKEKSFSELIKEKRDEFGWNQSQMAEALGMKIRMYQDYEGGKFEGQPARIEKYLEKLRKLHKDSLNEVAEPKAGYGNIIYVPLTAYGGFLHGYSNKVFLDGLERFTLPGIQGEHFAFEVDGMSMYDFAAPGDMAIAREEEKLEWMVKGKPYVLQTIDGLLIKLFEGITGDKAKFKSYNKDYDGLELPLKSIKRIYFVNRILKKT